MKMVNDIEPLNNELPSSFADRLGAHYSNLISAVHKKKYGQFFTPIKIASFMAGYYKCKSSEIKILDPGCGTAILSCALIESILKSQKSIHEIELTVYESDRELIPFTEASLKYLKKWLHGHKVKFIYVLHTNDFVLMNSETLENQNRNIKYYDLIISNPPYFKIQKNDVRAKVSDSIVHGQPNIYSIFLYTAAELLKENGQLIFIIPRSFTSGLYFRLFREKFFSLVQLDEVHLFESRKEAFRKDDVLQENVIISAKRTKANGNRHSIIVSSSHGSSDLEQRSERTFYSDELFDKNSHQKILHLPISGKEANIVRLFKTWKGNLNAYNIQISTGPVVSFRAKQFIFPEPKEGILYAPLYLLYNASKMKWSWPLDKNGKGQYIQVCEQTKPLLIRNKNYLFLRRFSSKDDHSRLIATPYFADSVDTDVIGVENHLNYIYRPNGHLDRSEILGLATLLNSSLFDVYFRTFNGNINVSATELREMPLPPLEVINEIGNALISNNNFVQSIIDSIVNKFFEQFKELSIV
ncbi:MAG: N-6 DNA methylase [Ignavibacteriaceae bacterium]|jgi:adenine-specific DNA-methyltransferase